MRIVRYQHPRMTMPRPTFLNPWAGFEPEIDRMMHAALTEFLPESLAAGTLAHPRADLYEDKDNFHFRVELPGLKRENIHLEMGDGVLNLSGSRETFATNGESKETTQFSRSVSVPARVQEDKIAARYEDGVLTVTLPKAEEVKPKRIAIQVK
jgi:HSP20 family protein